MCNDPGMSKNNLKVSAKHSITAGDVSSKFQQLKALPVQGEYFQSDAGSLDIWSMAIQSVPDAIMKFSMNAIPKKGNFIDCNNWRGIALLDVVGKVVARVNTGKATKAGRVEAP